MEVGDYMICPFCGCCNAISELEYPNRNEQYCPGCEFHFIHTKYEDELNELKSNSDFEEVELQCFFKKPSLPGKRLLEVDLNWDTVKKRIFSDFS